MAKRVTNPYTSNPILREEIRKSREAGKVTNNLARAIMLIASGLGRKGNWSGYTWRDEMESEAISMMLKGWMKYDEAKSDNPFAYLTRIAHNAFLRVLKEHKTQGDIRDALLWSEGASPSAGYFDRVAAEEAAKVAAKIAKKAK